MSHTTVLPARQRDYRCGGCGATAYRYLEAGAAAVTLLQNDHPQVIEPGGDGFYRCCEGRRFKWEEWPVPLAALG